MYHKKSISSNPVMVIQLQVVRKALKDVFWRIICNLVYLFFSTSRTERTLGTKQRLRKGTRLTKGVLRYYCRCYCFEKYRRSYNGHVRFWGVNKVHYGLCEKGE